MRRRPTDAERILWTALRDRQFRNAKFRRQVPIGRYIVDFVSFASRLIVELDGKYHDAERDRQRDVELGARGFEVLRFPNEAVTVANADVLNRIAAHLRRRDQSPADLRPLPPAGGTSS